MESTAKKIEFQPRPNLQRTLTYRPHVKWAYYVSLSYIGVAGLVVSAFTLGSIIAGRYDGDFWVGVIGLVGCAMLLVQTRYMLRPLAFSKVQVWPDRLELERVKEEISIPFAEIDSVRFSYVPYVGGWFTLTLRSKRQFKFTGVLERSEYILETLSLARPDIVPASIVENYRRTSIIIDHSWARYHDAFKSWRSTAARYVAAPIGLVLAWIVLRPWIVATPPHGTFMERWATLSLLLGITSAFIGVVIWMTTESAFIARSRSRLLTDPQDIRRDVSGENATIKKARLAHLALTAIAFVAFLVWRLH